MDKTNKGLSLVSQYQCFVFCLHLRNIAFEFAFLFKHVMFFLFNSIGFRSFLVPVKLVGKLCIFLFKSLSVYSLDRFRKETMLRCIYVHYKTLCNGFSIIKVGRVV